MRSFQVSQIFPKLTAREHVSLMVHGRVRRSGRPFCARSASRGTMRRRKVDAALARVGSLARAGDLVGTMSHGDRRLVEIAMALAAEPELLLLDEPTAGMSPEETRQTARLLRSLAPAVTLVIVEHDMSVVMSISDRISVLHRGEILAEGPPEAIRANREVQAVYLGGGRPPRDARRERALTGGYGETTVLWDVSFEMRQGAGGGAARPQRHGQDHDAARHHGADPAARRQRRASRTAS